MTSIFVVLEIDGNRPNPPQERIFEVSARTYRFLNFEHTLVISNDWLSEHCNGKEQLFLIMFAFNRHTVERLARLFIWPLPSLSLSLSLSLSIWQACVLLVSWRCFYINSLLSTLWVGMFSYIFIDMYILLVHAFVHNCLQVDMRKQLASVKVSIQCNSKILSVKHDIKWKCSSWLQCKHSSLTATQAPVR